MATERKTLDGVTYNLTGCSGAYTNITDDPDSPDGNFVTATNNTTSMAIHASMNDPTGNPTVGADLQEFRAYFEQFDEGQTGVPTARIELWESGVLVRAGSDINVPNGGVVLSFTWNANELATADGSNVEVNLVGTKKSGGGGVRNSTKCGAVEWNVDYTASATEKNGSDTADLADAES